MNLPNTFGPQLLLKAIPQRYPFMMIDKIVEHEVGKRAVCVKNITHGEEVFTGHFPGNPIYPGVLMIEMGLQTTQVMLTDLEALKTSTPSPSGAPQGYCVSVDRFRFKSVVYPGDVLRVTSTLKIEAAGLVKASIEINEISGREVATGEVSVTAAGAAGDKS